MYYLVFCTEDGQIVSCARHATIDSAVEEFHAICSMIGYDRYNAFVEDESMRQVFTHWAF